MKSCNGPRLKLRIVAMLSAFACLGLPPGATAVAGKIMLYPEEQRQLISDWGYDIKQDGKAGALSPEFARTLFVEDRMTCLRLPIYGDIRHPAHPADGQVIASHYAPMLQAMTNARAARANVILFASKKLEERGSFPDWVVDAKGVVPARYARMLADYLGFVQAHGFAIDILGIDNEMEYNHGAITPAKQREIVDDLRSLARQRGFTMPKHLIGPDTFNPNPGWLSTLVQSGWGDRLDMVGTHYYPGPHRPQQQLQRLAQAAGSRPLWHTELHWQGKAADGFEAARESLAAFFDCTGQGFSGFAWWDYRRTGVKGGIEKALTQSTANSRPIRLVNGVTGPGQFIMRAFRNEAGITVWAINMAVPNADSFRFELAGGAIAGNVGYEQWTATGSTTGAATRLAQNAFTLKLPIKTITKMVVPFPSAGGKRS
jgi:O-glycosyl hydrolase